MGPLNVQNLGQGFLFVANFERVKISSKCLIFSQGEQVTPVCLHKPSDLLLIMATGKAQGSAGMLQSRFFQIILETGTKGEQWLVGPCSSLDWVEAESCSFSHFLEGSVCTANVLPGSLHILVTLKWAQHPNPRASSQPWLKTPWSEYGLGNTGLSHPGSTSPYGSSFMKVYSSRAKRVIN